MKLKVSLILASVLLAACGYLPLGAKNAPNPELPKTNVSTDPVIAVESTPNAVTGSGKKNLLAIGNGAFVVEKSSEGALNWVALNIIDELREVGWGSRRREVANQSLVIEFPAKTTLKTIVFDTGAVDTDKSAAKDITLEMSDVSATDGFKEILSTTLREKQDGQEFAVKQPISGRWLRLKVANNYGSVDWLEIMDIRGYGEQEPLTPLANVSGTYESRFGTFHIKQEGISVVGCYDANEGVFQGGIENRVMTLNWKDKAGSGPALMVFSQEGKTFLGAYGKDTIDDGFYGEWSGRKVSDQVGSCPHLKTLEGEKAVQSQIGKAITDNGRALVRGISFDFNSDVIKPESKTTLDQITAVLQENKDWKMTIEGHTDNVGGDALNKTLSEKRASAVKAYLIGKGIDAGRLSSSGMGMSKPVSSNETEAGRAQNRRVELVKN